MLRIITLLAAAALCLPAADPAKAGLDAGRLRQIETRMKSYVDGGTASGIVTLVQRNGVLAALDAAGFQDSETKRPMRADTIFQVMSMTKPVTGVAVMMLAEEGKLRLSDPVEKILPEFRGQMVIESKTETTRTLKKLSRPITIRDLMTHTSGMPEMPPEGAGDYFAVLSRLTLKDAVLLYSQMPLQFEPGSRLQYSNTGLATLGRIVEVASDVPYEQFVAKRIFEPLSMKDSFFFPPADKLDRIAQVYMTQSGVRKPLGDLIYRKGAKYPMPEGGLYSTAQDLANFYQMMLDGGAFQGRRLLSKAAVETMTALHTGDLKAGSGSTGFGLTWQVQRDSSSMLTLQSMRTFGHGGAFGTYGWIDPSRKLVGVFLLQELGRDVSEPRATFVTMAESAVLE
ncbi:MAG: beta-lactamase family protein [Bryobacterales bacterium]|nr:beta-lactamase family protein [Bryobacterales bacterium]